MSAVNNLSRSSNQTAEIDPLLLWVTLLLLSVGLVMVYSSSITIAAEGKHFGNQSTFFLVRQMIFLSIGCVAAAIVFMVPSGDWRQWAGHLFIVGVILLTLVLIPGIGKTANGATRWIDLGLFNLQPSEAMKLCVLIYAADFSVRKMQLMGSLKRTFWPMVGTTMLLVGGLLIAEPDFGAFVIIVSISFGILFFGGMKTRPFIILLLLLLVSFALLIWFEPYRRERLFGFMDPWQDEFGRGYQLSHALIAFGNGEIFGSGLGASVQKLFYLPEAHTDFLLAIVGEELGFIGVVAVVAMFALLVFRIFAVGLEAQVMGRVFQALVAMGAAIWFGVQGLINMLVNVGLLPTKGLTLPLMSFGGSSLVMNCVMIGILLRIDWENRQMRKGKCV